MSCFTPTQALAVPNAKNGNYVVGYFNGEKVGNLYNDPRLHLQVPYALRQGTYHPDLACPKGIVDVNSQCSTCASAPPYSTTSPQYQKAEDHMLFSPYQPFVQPTAAVKALIAERSPLPANQGCAYTQMDQNPL